MKIKALQLYTNQLEAEKAFYIQTIGCPVLQESESQFSVKVGWSTLTFVTSTEPHRYHYCFLIPSNKLTEALEWMRQRLTVLTMEDATQIVNFDTWNADSFYFYDGSGNLAECIVRYDLHNESATDFSIDSLLCVNEIGLGTDDVQHLNAQLEKELNTDFWKGDLERFGTNGSQEGLFLIPNYNLKATWFPTDILIKASPIEAIIENDGQQYKVAYQNGKLSTNQL